MTPRPRNGFTLVELVIVAVLGALVLGATLQVLITNQRTYTAQNAQVQGQQASRMALDILSSELREVSAVGGDILAATTDSIRVRRMRKFGVVCSAYLSGNKDFTVLRVGNLFSASDSVFVFADNNENSYDDDVWIGAQITQVGSSSTTCPDGSEGQDLRFQGQDALFTNDSVRVGAPIRSYLTYTYGTTTYQGSTFLARRVGSGDWIPIAGPLRASGGLEFRYRRADGEITGDLDDIRQIEVKVKTGSNVMNSLGQMVSDSITAWIYTRN